MPLVAVSENGRVLSYDHMWSSAEDQGRAIQRKLQSPVTALPPSMQKAGFEVKMVEHDGRERPMVVDARGRVFSEAAVYVGPLSTEAKLGNYQWRMRQNATPARARAFRLQFEYLRKSNFDPDLAFALLRREWPSEAKALSESLDPQGGFLVPPDWVAEVWSSVAENSLMSLCTVRPTTSDLLYVPRFLPSTSQPSVYSSQLQPTVTGETTTQAAADVHFGALQVPIRPIRSKIRMSRDLMSDASYALSALQDAFAKDLGAQISQQIIRGPDFNGILNDPNVVEVSLQPGAGDTLSATSENQWRALKSSLPGQYRDDSVVVMGGDLQAAFENQAPGASGRPAITRHNDVTGQYLFDEVPLVTSGFMPPYGQPGLVLAYGSLEDGFLVAQRADVSMTIISESTAADSDSVDIVLRARLGGTVQARMRFASERSDARRPVRPLR